MRSRAAMLLALAIGIVGVAGPVQARVPGENGQIAFAQDDPASAGDTFVFTANADGSNAEPLFPGYHAGAPRWSPDGSAVAILSSGDQPCCGLAVVIVDPVTGRVRELPMPDPTLFTACWVWSPDATRLACEGSGDDPSRTGIYTIRSSDGGGLTRITSNPGGDDIPIDYSPDGRRLVLGRTDPSRPASADAALFVADLDGSGLRRITPWGFSDDDGAWSPDGTRIVFGSRGSLYVVHPDGTGLAKIPLPSGGISDAFDPAWSPDGTKIVFAGRTRGQGSNIYIANADGTGLVQVTHGGSYRGPDWGTHPPTTSG